MRIKQGLVSSGLIFALAGAACQPSQQPDPARRRRRVDERLAMSTAPSSPSPSRSPLPITEVDARKAKAPPRFEVKPPQGAPNVVIVLIDDIGFGHSSAFGGPINMPTLEKMATSGLRYNRFHTTALCSPTRTALLTGRNHHVNNAGAIMELATAFPGNTGVRPDSVAPLAEILRLNGYSTAAFGKYHETAPWEASVSGPFDRWPTRLGVRQVLRLHRRRDEPVGAGGLRRRDARRGPARPELPLHDRHDQPGHRLDALPAGDDAGQAVLHVLRHRSDACAAPRPEGVHRRSTRASSIRAGTSCAKRRWRGRSSWAWCRPGTKLTAAAGRDSGVGLAVRRSEAAVRAADGNVRRLRRAHRPRGRPAGGGAPRHGRARQHALLLHRRRQRLERRRRARRHLQRDARAQRHRQRRGVAAAAHRRVGRADDVPALLHRLGARRQHAVPVDQAGGVALRRHAQPAWSSHWPARIKARRAECARSSTT